LYTTQIKFVKSYCLDLLNALLGFHFRPPFIISSVHLEMVDFGSEQGLSDFETAGIAGYFEDFKRAKMQLWAKRCRFRMDTANTCVFY
ncbi:MAG: hypothetical protein NTY86_02405, partial [Deltaproteobacteria bacterium]|nr:hypothetical protein [Deltaproteobacteria bacterium]